ncbi:hypothetical protein HPP92_020816 [Vanilla planifolia]|uniref:Uncharacterized protein n=1 Tax=Vanilla planifolia TaxID=51239 RepID=A0A835PYN0_VANPL|nr:hypothetical protein HPP92_021188 [Vanilla planifolia]KAG0462340.1 hypothetical protein HPP92_020816 [Vanilla planifolia]
MPNTDGFSSSQNATAGEGNSNNMWALFLTSWQLPDGRFPAVKPIFRRVRGPAGLSIVLVVARCCATADGRVLRYEGFSRIYRLFSAGFSDYRLFNFVATPCPTHRMLHFDTCCGFRGGDDGLVHGHYEDGYGSEGSGIY